MLAAPQTATHPGYAGALGTSLLPLPLARYRLEFAVRTPLNLPAFAGSTLRGAFGTALRASVCMTKAETCDACRLLASCPYATVFEPRPPTPCHPLQAFDQIPRPYIIEPPAWGEQSYAPGQTVAFHIVLAGRAVAQLPLILWAFHLAFGRGVGKGGGTGVLARVWHVNGHEAMQIADGPGGKVADHVATVAPMPAFGGTAITLHFDHPLRLQTNGRRASAEEFTPRKLLSALVRRVALIHEFHGAAPLALDFKTLAAQAETLGSAKRLAWRDWARYSNRQQQRHELGGVVGTWKLQGDLAPFMPFLHLGQWLHVGKEAAFGLGAYQMELT